MAAGLLELAGIRPRDRAHHLAHLLSVSHRPVTLMFRDRFGVELRPETVRRGEGRLSPVEAVPLEARAFTPCKWRTARLVTGDGRTAAGVFLCWVPGVIAELSARACAELDAGEEAAGVIMSRLPGGMHREDLRAVAADRLDEITGEMASVRSRACLVTRGGPAGFAEENFLRGFVESLT